jgi:hydrogenase expression/formation protein HypE
LTRGGLLNALNDLVDACQKSVVIDGARIPVRREVRMGCEMLGLDPLTLVNEGKMLMAVGSTEAEKVLEALKRHPLGQDSSIIGEVVERDSPYLILREDDRLKILSRVEGDAIPRLC